MKDFLILLGWLSLAGSLLGLAVAAVGRLSRGALSQRFCCALWVLVLLRLALPVGAPQALGGYAPFLALQQRLTVLQAESPAQQETAESTGGTPQASAPAKDAADTGSAPQTPALPKTEPVQPAEDAQKQESPAQNAADGAVPADSTGTKAVLPQALTVSLPQALFGIWAIGAVLRFAWKLSSYRLYRRRLLRWAAPAAQETRIAFAALYNGSHLRLVSSPEVHAALLLGVKDPVLVLPQQLPAKLQTPAAIEAALRHELAHYRRGDLWLKWAAELVGCLHWFNPLLPLLRREIGRACELACDEAVIRTMNAAQKQAYGEMLIALAGKQGRAPVPLTAICEYKHQLKERLVCIMTYKKKNLLSAVACCCLLALLCGCAAALGPAEETPDTTESTVTESTVTESVEEPTESTTENASGTAADIVYAFDAEAMRKEATVLTVGEIINEYVRTEVVNLGMKGEMDFVNYRTYVLTGGRLWTTGYKKPVEENAPAPRRIVSYNTDGSDVQFLTLTAPALDESVFGTLPADHEWHQIIETLLDFGEAQPRVLREVIKYGPLDEGYLNALGGFGYYVCSFDENGVLDEGTPLDFTPQEGWFLNYLCSTPGKLWFKAEQSLGLGEAGSLLSFSMEDLGLLDTIPLPEGSSCLDAQGLADGRVVIQLANPYPSGHGAAYHINSYRLAIADPDTDTLSTPILLPEPFYIPFEPLATHSLSELPTEPTVVQSSMFTWDLETNTLHMTAEAASFGRNIELSISNFIPRADGSVLVLEYDSSRLVIATPYPPEG